MTSCPSRDLQAACLIWRTTAVRSPWCMHHQSCWIITIGSLFPAYPTALEYSIILRKLHTQYEHSCIRQTLSTVRVVELSCCLSALVRYLLFVISDTIWLTRSMLIGRICSCCANLLMSKVLTWMASVGLLC